MNTDPVTLQNKEERFWCVSGTIRYTLEDGSWYRYRFVSRNVAASDMQSAADNELEKIPLLLSKMKGVKIVDSCWDSEPEVSSLDPHIDR